MALSVLDATGNQQTIETLPSVARKAASASLPVTLSTEDKTALDAVATAAAQAALNTLVGAVTETAPASDTASSGLNGRLQRIAQRLTTLVGGVSATITSSALPTGAATEASTLDLITSSNSIATLLATPATTLPKRELVSTSDLTRANQTRSTSGETSLVTATASQTTRVHRIICSAAAAVTVSLLSGSGGTVLFVMEFPAAGVYILDFDERPYAKTATNTALYFSTDAAAAVDLQVWYVKDAN